MKTKRKKSKITVEEFDKKFDEGEDIIEYLDLKNGEHVNKVQRINLDLPHWMLMVLDREATRLAIPRQAVIKTILDRYLQSH